MSTRTQPQSSQAGTPPALPEGIGDAGSARRRHAGSLSAARLLAVPLAFAAAVGAATACDDDSGGVGPEPQVDFQPGPPSFPPGSEIAVMQGDPSQGGVYTVRLRFPQGYQLPPHFHPTDENVTVLNGTFLVGMGDSVDLSVAMKLGPGGFIVAPALAHHFAVAQTQSIVQVHGQGPFAITYVNPADDPAR